MENTTIGKIKKVPLRELWKKEDKDFTKWLEENIDYLNDVLGFDISIESREENVGPFYVDLYGEDDDGNKVIIENQLEKTDHKHLGQIITYLTNLEAKTAIWISSDPVEEHRKAIDWLNETTPDDISFYLIQLEAIKIGNESIAGPLFTVVKRPSENIKQIGVAKKEDAQSHSIRKEFWTQFINEINKTNTMCSNASPGKGGWWLVIVKGMSGVSINIVIGKKHVRTEIYINTGSKENNKKIFDDLCSHKKEIELDFGASLIWEDKKNTATYKIKKQLDNVDVFNKDNWEKIHKFLIDSVVRMNKAFKKHISETNKTIQL